MVPPVAAAVPVARPLLVLGLLAVTRVLRLRVPQVVSVVRRQLRPRLVEVATAVTVLPELLVARVALAARVMARPVPALQVPMVVPVVSVALASPERSVSRVALVAKVVTAVPQ